MQLNRPKAELLFRLISERYEHGSVILTSNKYFSDWGELLSDNVLDTALLWTALLQHSHVMNIRGQTYRLRERMKAGVQLVPPVDFRLMTNRRMYFRRVSLFLFGVDSLLSLTEKWVAEMPRIGGNSRHYVTHRSFLTHMSGVRGIKNVGDASTRRTYR